MRTTILSLFIGALTGTALAGGAACEALARSHQALTLRVTPERDYMHTSGGREVVVQVDVEGKRVEGESRVPVNLVVVLDRSGSMEGAKIEKARQAAAAVLDKLRPGDCFSMVIYSNRAEVLIPPARLDSGTGREAMRERIHGIRTSGGTALYAGVELGAEQLRRFFDKEQVNRVILLSDGLANVGPSRPRDLADFGKSLRKAGMGVTTIGLGDDYNEDLMTGLAEASAANYYHVEDAEKLPGIFAEEIGAAGTLLARGVTIRIKVPAGVRLKEIIGHPEIRCDSGTAEITVPEYFGADRRRLLAKCVVETLEGDSVPLADVTLSYEDARSKATATQALAARINVTRDEAQANESVRAEITREVGLLANRIDKEQAVKLADEGRAVEAANLLRTRAAANASAPAAAQIPNMADENRKLEDDAAGLTAARRLGKSTRKRIQWENYQQRNQKEAVSN